MRKLNYSKIKDAVVNALSSIGGWIVTKPNPLSYVFLIAGCILMPYFAVFLLICILIWASGVRYAVRYY